jgi:hypothetical protein
VAGWAEIAAVAPDLAAEVRRRFTAAKHATLATLRADGSPRISGTETEWDEADVFLGSMPGAVKAMDLRRDARFALHSPTADPDESDPSAWPGEAKLSGRAVEVGEPAAGEPHRFRLDIAEVVLTRVAGNRLEITSWHADRGVEVRHRD